MSKRPLRLMIYDPSCRHHTVSLRGARRVPLGLSHAWRLGGALYRGLGRLDRVQPVASWAEALDWLASFAPERPIGEIQFWGHGKWGSALIDGAPLTVVALEPGHALHDGLRAVRERLSGAQALWWFRTCETFGAVPGQRFARAWTQFFGCRAAGHTYVIGPWQSGLHSLSAGERPQWSPEEGLAAGTPEHPRRAIYSTRHEPHTIHCLRGTIPDGW